MTHPPDDVLNALVDDEAVDAADASHVAGCAACQARLGALRRVAATVAEPVTVPAHLREAAVAAAMVEATGAGGAVRRIATARRARAKAAPARRRSAASAAAALLVGLGVGGWLLSQAGTDSEQTTANKASALTAGLDARGHDQPEAAAIYNAGDIGDFDHPDGVIARYREYASGAVTTGSYIASPPCPTPANRPLVWHAELTFTGIEAYARVVVKSRTDRVLEILGRADCALVESQAI